MSALDPALSAGEETIWHDVECGAYAADLGLWPDLAQDATGPVLELGCGTGRVALELAAAGHEVVAVDSAAELLAALADRAERRGLTVETRVGDVRELDLAGRFALICAPMQLVHLLGGPSGRAAMLERSRAHLTPGGVLAVALLSDDVDPALDGPPALPDVREHDGWIYSSQPLDARADEREIVVRRLRQVVSPEGALRERVEVIALDRLGVDELESEALERGLAARERIEIPPTADHVGSTVVVLEAA